MALKTTVERNVTIEVGWVKLHLTGSDDEPVLQVESDHRSIVKGAGDVAESLADLSAAVRLLERHLGIARDPELERHTKEAVGRYLALDTPEIVIGPAMVEDGKPKPPPPGRLSSLAARVAAAQSLAGSKAEAEPTDPADAERARAAAYGYTLDEDE